MESTVETENVSFAARARAVGEILAAVVALFVAGALIALAIGPLLPERLVMPATALSLWAGVLMGRVFLGLSRQSYRALGFRRPNSWARTLGVALAAVVIAEAGAGGLAWTIASFTDWPELDVAYIRNSIEGDTFSYAAWMIFVVWGSAAFGEELFARGFALDRFRTVFAGAPAAALLAIFAQAALFGWLHAVQGPTGVVITGYVGLVFAAAYFAAGRNLWAPILAHGLIDTISLTLMYLGVPLPMLE
jgi:membrane protease YdiL (CAAX protease family)